MREAVGRLATAAGECARTPMFGLSETELLTFLDEVFRAQQMVQAALLHAVREVEGRGIPAGQQAATANMWLRERLRVSSSTAGMWLTQARMLDAHQDLDAAVTAGAVNAEQLGVITTELAQLPKDLDAPTLARARTVLLDWAQHLDPRQLRIAARRILEHVSPEVMEAGLDEGREEARLRRAEQEAREQRFLTLTSDGDGRVRVRGLLDSESAAVITAALDPLCRPAATRTELAETGETRTPGQRRADALVDVCRLALSGGSLPEQSGARPQLAITASYDVLRGELGPGVLEDGEPVSAETVRRLACDSRILPLIFGGESQVLDAGRTRRLVSGVQRRALMVRDRGCTFPGCDRPGRWCEAHHMNPWSEGGNTDLRELALLCGFHHQVIHGESGWQIRPGPDGRPEFLPPPSLDPQRVPRQNQYHRRT
ncbi:DUF222 domain-containing protein [Actinoplanes missouriensis]|uniref:HNH endonuclease signature motif containing protein n=1 Tax=Actinoplanes missouriensis TaxID=1866 RepID=UPI0033D21411